MSGDFCMQMYLISIVLLVFLSSEYGVHFLSRRPLVFGKVVVTSSNQISTTSRFLDSHLTHSKDATSSDFPVHQNVSKGQISQERISGKENTNRYTRNLRGGKSHVARRKVHSKYSTKGRKSRVHGKNKRRWKGTFKKKHSHIKQNDIDSGAKLRDSSVSKLYDKAGSHDSRKHGTEEADGKESGSKAHLIFLAILIILMGSFFLVFLFAKFYPNVGKRLLPCVKRSGYTLLEKEDKTDKEDAAGQMKDVETNCTEQDELIQFEQLNDAKWGQGPSKSNDETSKFIEQQAQYSQEGKKNAGNLTSSPATNGNPKEAGESSAFSRILPIFMGKYRGFQGRGEESGSAQQLQSCSESDLSDISVNNWSWPTRFAKSVFRGISNKLAAKKIPESNDFKDGPSKEVLIDMDALSMESLARNSVSQPFQVQKPIKSGEFEQDAKYGTEDDYVSFTISNRMNHEVMANEDGCNLESFGEFCGGMDTESSLDQSKERRKSSDAGHWCQEKPKGKRRKQTTPEEISKRQKCNDEREFIYVIHNASYESSESDSKSKETNSEEFKRSQHAAHREMKPLLYKTNKMYMGKSDDGWHNTNTRDDNSGEKHSFQTRTKCNRKTPVNNPTRSEWRQSRELKRKEDISDESQEAVIRNTEESAHKTYHVKPVQKMYARGQYDQSYDLCVGRKRRSRSYTIVQDLTSDHMNRMYRCHSLSSIHNSNEDKVRRPTCIEENFLLNSQDNRDNKIESDSKRDVHFPAQHKNENIQLDQVPSTVECEKQKPDSHDLRRHSTQSISFTDQQPVSIKNESLLSDNLISDFHESTPIEITSPLQQQKHLSNTSLWRTSPPGSAAGENIITLNRIGASSNSFLYCDSEELVVARETRGLPDNQVYPNGAQKAYDDDVDDDDEYGCWLKSRSTAFHSRKGSDHMVNKRHDSGIGSLSRSTIYNSSNKSLKNKDEHVLAGQFSGNLHSMSNKSIQTVPPRNESKRRWKFVKKFFKSKTPATEACIEEGPLMKKNKSKCRQMKKKLIKSKLQKNVKVK